jgi:hypothetical protein
LGEPGKFEMGDVAYSMILKESPDVDIWELMGMNPVDTCIGLMGWGATGVVDRLVYCGVRFGLSLGEGLLELVELDELGLAIRLDQGLLDVVGVVLLLVVDDTEEAVGDGGPRFAYQVGSSWRLTIDMV